MLLMQKSIYENKSRNETESRLIFKNETWSNAS